MFHVACVLAALLAADEPQDTVTLGPRELTTMLGKGPERDKLLKEYHGREVRLTGKVTVREERVELWVSDRRPTPTHALVPVEFADGATKKKVQQLAEEATAARKDAVLTLVGRADFRRTVLKPSPEYVVPEALKPKPFAVRVLPGAEAWEKMQKAMLEAERQQQRILEDARRKKQVVTAEDWGLYGLQGARVGEPPPKKKPDVARPDPEKTAAAKLALARQLLEEPRTRGTGLAKLKEIVRDFPDTQAAAEARELLKGK